MIKVEVRSCWKKDPQDSGLRHEVFLRHRIGMPASQLGLNQGSALNVSAGLTQNHPEGRAVTINGL